MALYINNQKFKINLIDGVYLLNIGNTSSLPVVNGVLMRDVDNKILTDSNGVYITAKRSE